MLSGGAVVWGVASPHGGPTSPLPAASSAQSKQNTSATRACDEAKSARSKTLDVIEMIEKSIASTRMKVHRHRKNIKRLKREEKQLRKDQKQANVHFKRQATMLLVQTRVEKMNMSKKKDRCTHDRLISHHEKSMEKKKKRLLKKINQMSESVHRVAKSTVSPDTLTAQSASVQTERLSAASLAVLHGGMARNAPERNYPPRPKESIIMDTLTGITKALRHPMRAHEKWRRTPETHVRWRQNLEENAPVAVLHLVHTGEGVPAEGTSVPLSINLRPGKTILGRERECDVVLDSVKQPRMVSKIHACITVARTRVGSEDGWHIDIADCNSTNGTFVNGRRIKGGRIELIEGSTILIGKRGRKGRAGSELLYTFSRDVDLIDHFPIPLNEGAPVVHATNKLPPRPSSEILRQKSAAGRKTSMSKINKIRVPSRDRVKLGVLNVRGYTDESYDLSRTNPGMQLFT